MTATLNPTFLAERAALTLCERREEGLSYSHKLRERQRKTRVYGAVNTFSQDHMDAEPYQGQHLYDEKIQPDLWAKMSNAERDEMLDKVNIWKKWKRDTLKPARLGAIDAVNELIADGSYTFEPHTEGIPLRMAFSAKAGCSCPCSPGFIMNGRVLDSDGKAIDIWMDLPSS